MKNIKLTIMLSAVISLTGCSIYHINSEDITTDYYPSKKSVEDVVYLEDIAEPHQIIGHITVNAERRQRIDDVIQKMKREAAILGGDAITNLQSDSTGAWKQLPAQQAIGNAYIRANFSASIVVFK